MMFSFFVRLVIIFSLPMTAFAVGSVLLGRTQPVHPALRGFVEGCADTSRPCWYGIIPGRTTLAEALMLLEQHGLTAQPHTVDSGLQYDVLTDNCVFNIIARRQTTSVRSISAVGCSNLRLGDFILVFGAPFIILAPTRDNGCGVAPPIGSLGIVFRLIDFHRGIPNAETTSVQTEIISFYIDGAVASSDLVWDEFPPYGHFGRAAHRSPRRCSG